MGLFNKIKSAIGISNESKSEEISEFKTIFSQTIQEQLKESQYFYTFTFSAIPTYNDIIKKWDNEKKGEFAIFLSNTVKKTYLQYRKGDKQSGNEYKMS